MTKAESHYYLQTVCGFTNRPVLTINLLIVIVLLVVFAAVFCSGYLSIIQIFATHDMSLIHFISGCMSRSLQ
jgi:hypothetical protein